MPDPKGDKNEFKTTSSTTFVLKNKLEEKKFDIIEFYIPIQAFDKLKSNGEVVPDGKGTTISHEDTSYYFDESLMLGKGAFGTVYAAQDSKSGSWIAIKRQHINSTSEYEKKALNQLNQLKFYQTQQPHKYSNIQFSEFKKDTEQGFANDTIFFEKFENNTYHVHFYNPDENNWDRVILASSDLQGLCINYLPEEERGNLVKNGSVSPKNISNFLQALASVTKHPFAGYEIIGMPLTPGKNFQQFLNEEGSRKLKIARRIDLTLSVVSNLKDIHENKLIHRDIKPENMIVSDHELSLVDFGLTLSLNDKNEVKPSVEAGTPEYLPKEITGINPRKVELTLTPKCDIYALGLSLGWMYGLAKENKEKKKYEIVDKNDSQFKQNKKIPDAKQREAILNHLKWMTSDIPSHRPTLEETFEFFNDIRTKELSALSILNQVVCLNVADYIKLKSPEKDKLLAQLQKSDEVWLTTSPEEKIDLTQLYIELRKNNIVINQQVIVCEPEMQKQAIQDYAQQKEKKDGNIYITHRCEIFEKENGLEPSKFDFKIKHPFLVSENHLTKVIQALTADLERIRTDYPESPKYIGRLIALEATIGKLQNKLQNDSLTYSDLNKKLNLLQNKLYSPSALFKLGEHLHLTKSKSRKVVHTLIDEATTISKLKIR